MSALRTSMIRALRISDPTPDAALVQAAAHGDDDAFRTLIARHGPMVLRVCRQVLGDGHAAEDAFQAVFLVFVQRAARIARPERLAAWLFSTARHIALRGKRSADRRRKHESRSRPRPVTDPSADLTVRELLQVLDEEVERLPETNRLPVLLCYWQNLTQDEAARRLGWTAGSLRGRLERGRKILVARLTKRGLAPTVLLAVSAATVAIPADLLAKTAALTVAGAVIPASVLTLIGASGAGKALSVSIAAALIVGVGTIGIAGGWAEPQNRNDSPALIENERERVNLSPVVDSEPIAPPKDAPAGPNAVLEGNVVDEVNRPVAGAIVQDIDSGPHKSATTDAAGRFRLDLDRTVATTGAYLAATPDGSQQSFLRLAVEEYGRVATARFVVRPSRLISVKVADERGNGVAGATVVAVQYHPFVHAITNEAGAVTLRVPAGVDIDAIVAAKAGVGFDYRGCPPALTDAQLVLDGARTARFRALDANNRPLAGIRLRLIHADKNRGLRAPNMGDCWMPPFNVPTNDQGIAECTWIPAKMTTSSLFGFGSARYTYRENILKYPSMGEPTIDVKFLPKFTVSGRVTKPDGSPAPGILVVAGSVYHSARTEADGRYSLMLPQNDWQMLTVIDKDWTSEAETNSIGRSFDNFDFHLVPGAVVSGRVTIGTPPRPAVKESISFELRNMSAYIRRTAPIDDDGRYSIRLGPAHYTVVGPESTPIGALKITDQSSITRDYQIEKLRRFTIEGAIKRPDGSPAGHAEIMTAALNLDRGPSGSLGIASAQADADGRFHFVRERVEQMFYAFDPKSGLAAFEKIGADAERETLTLKPGATARIRLINADGKPIQNARIYVSIFCDEFTAGNPLGWDRKVSSDRNGVATIMGLALGSRCRLLAPAIDKDVAVTIANIEVKEVKDFDLGEIVPKAGSK